MQDQQPQNQQSNQNLKTDEQEAISQEDESQEQETQEQNAPEQTLNAQPPKQTQEVPNRLVQQVKSIGAPIPGKLEQLKAFILECKRVLRVTKKPDKQEYTTIVKISAIGMAIIGAIGFLIFFAKEILF